MATERPEPRFKKDDTVYVSSRYNGILPRIIQSNAFYDDQSSDQEDWLWVYELNKPVQVRRHGESIGVKTAYLDEYNLFHCPAPEYALMLIGDKIYSSHWAFSGIVNEVLTIDKINDGVE